MKAAAVNARHTVLLIEDNPGDARLMRAYLSEPAGTPYALEHAPHLAAGLEWLARGGIDLVLLDLTLPDSNPEDTFKRVQAAAPQTPIIVLSGLHDEEFAARTVQQGAQDYLLKDDVNTRLLVHAMRYAIERKRVAEAFTQERDLFHTLLDNIPDRVFFKDLTSRFTRINRSLCEHFHIPHPRDAAGRSDRDFFTAEHADAALRDEQQVIRTGEPMLGKIERETLPDGGAAWALTSKLPLKNRQGQVVGTFGISRDITELKAIEEQLKTERNLLRSLIDNLPDYIYVKDAEGRYVMDNLAHRQLLGVSTEQEILGKKLTDFFDPQTAAQFVHDDEEILRTGKPLLNLEEAVVDRLGRKRWHATTKVPLRNSAGRIYGLVGISRDVTARKEQEEQLQQANAQLECRKEELQRALDLLRKSHDDLKAAQFQLIEAEKMQSIGRLAAGVAHEVKNPLGILRMGVDYLAQNVPTTDENVAPILEDMAGAIRRADGIILGLLDFSAPHALDSRAEDVNTIVEASLTLVRYDLGSIRLERELTPGLPPAWVDRNKLQQVLVNVLTNAIHAMPQGGVLAVRTSTRQLRPEETGHDDGSRQARRFRAGESVIVIEMLDSGAGIAEDKLAQIYDPFFTTKPAGQGTGLGLTVTKRIVELHGGAIDIRNRKEGGVAVSIMFKV
jgi:PAS domain S-box-containing protein